jgi:uncharacterized membrane protein
VLVAVPRAREIKWRELSERAVGERTAATGLSRVSSGRLKWVLFAFMAVATIIAVYGSEGFLFNANDPEWKHIAPFRWLLLVHALAGVTALLAGPLQFSTRLRTARPAFHRMLGRVYVGAVAIAAPLAVYIGVTFEKPPLSYEQWAQGGIWFLATLIAFVAIRKRQVPLHRQWMMRSYAFTFIFVSSRVPFAFPAVNLNNGQLTTLLWYLIVVALVVPDLPAVYNVLFSGGPRSTLK